MNYYNTLIEVAEDCPVAKAEAPQPKGGNKTKPVLEYEMIANHPYQYTQEDIAFETHALVHRPPRLIGPKSGRNFYVKAIRTFWSPHSLSAMAGASTITQLVRRL